MWRALSDLGTTGEKFSIADIAKRAQVGRSFLYDTRRPKMREAVLSARRRSQGFTLESGTPHTDPGWQQRALNCEEMLANTRNELARSELHIKELVSLAFESDGTATLSRLEALQAELSDTKLKNRRMALEIERLKRSLNAVRTQLHVEQVRSMELLPDSKQ